ncbi:hypothetical protein Tco_1030820, partial [Tanacetum coccineum]
ANDICKESKRQIINAERFHMDSANADRCKEELPPLYADLRDSSWQRHRKDGVNLRKISRNVVVAVSMAVAAAAGNVVAGTGGGGGGGAVEEEEDGGRGGGVVVGCDKEK